MQKITMKLTDLNRLAAEGWRLCRYETLEEQTFTRNKRLDEIIPDLEVTVTRPDMGNKCYIEVGGIRLIVEDGKITGWYCHEG